MDVSLDKVPEGHRNLDGRMLEGEAMGLLDRMLSVLQENSRCVLCSYAEFSEDYVLTIPLSPLVTALSLMLLSIVFLFSLVPGQERQHASSMHLSTSTL